MKRLILSIILFTVALQIKAQYTSDTLDFSLFASGTAITDQYLPEGVIFEGYDGSGDPVTYDYGATLYGTILHSDDWYNPIKLNFTDTLDASVYHVINKIAFDNPIDSEVDYITVDAYDSLDVLVVHYLSTSPEHVMLDFTTSPVAYIILDDSASTAYIIDNIVVEFRKENIDTTTTDTTTNDTTIVDTTIVDTTDLISVQFRAQFSIFPNPSSSEVHIQCDAVMDAVEITNSEGQLMYALRPEEKDVTVRFSEAGVYFVTITSEGQKVTKKLWVQ